MPKTHCLTLQLKNDAALISEYERYHEAENVWPEVIASIQESGILDMQIYRLDTLLVMIMTVTDDFSFERKAKLDSENETVQKWERLMEKFQQVPDGEQGKWLAMNRIFQLSS